MTDPTPPQSQPEAFPTGQPTPPAPPAAPAGAGAYPPAAPAAAPAAGQAPYGAAYPAGAPAAAPAPVPGRGLSIAALVFAFVIPPVGLVLGIIAAVKLSKAGAPKGMAIAAIIIGAVFTIGWIIGIAALGALFAAVFGACAELGPGVWTVDGVTYTCG